MDDRYRVIRKLAEGGSGETYLIWDRRLAQNWVMKRIRTGREGGEEAVRREMTALQQVRREGIPVLADVYYERDAVCLIMEYMTGVSLEELLDREGAMKEADAIRYALQIAELLEFLHGLPGGLVHGDLKPANLLLSQGRMALLDFGGAVFQYGASAAEGYFYTPGYGAPELEKGGQVTILSDIYAFGATLFSLVTGDRPDSDRGMYPVREQNPSLSAALEQIVLRCTNENPRERYASVGEVKTKLTALLLQHKNPGRLRGIRKRLLPEKEGKHRFQTVRCVLLTEGNFRGKGGTFLRCVLLLLTGICLGGFAAPKAAHAAQMQILPVSVRNGAGEKLLVDFDAVYYTKENPIFELPLHYFEPGRQYRVTIRQEEQENGTVRERSFVICAG